VVGDYYIVLIISNLKVIRVRIVIILS